MERKSGHGETTTHGARRERNLEGGAGRKKEAKEKRLEQE